IFLSRAFTFTIPYPVLYITITDRVKERRGYVKSLYFFPAKNLMISIPVVLMSAVIVGFLFDTSWMSSTILIATMLMIYPTMINLQWKALLSFKEKKLMGFALLINFILIPLIGFLLGLLFLKNEPILFAG